MSIGDRLLEKAANRLHVAGVMHRSDLSIIDAQPIDKHACMVLVAYDRGSNVPTGKDLELYFQAMFGDKVYPKLESARHHQGEAVITLLASAPAVTRPIEDAGTEGMVMMHALAYMDTVTNQVWDVGQDEANRKFLVRRSGEDINTLVEARKRRTRHSAPKLASLLTTAMVDVVAGDRVRFYDHGLIAYGQVKTVNASKATISTSSGEVTIDRAAIFNVVTKSQEFISEERNALQQYFEKAFGDANFSQQLTNTTVKDKAKGVVSPFAKAAAGLKSKQEYKDMWFAYLKKCGGKPTADQVWEFQKSILTPEEVLHAEKGQLQLAPDDPRNDAMDRSDNYIQKQPAPRF